MIIEILITLIIICSALYIFYKSFKKSAKGDCSCCSGSKSCSGCSPIKKNK
ncbi:FeoB-associated Cys-rich membrane protein [Clostridium felsineum]|uniref:FeoB-associated Cys-rich membrane protein n=1 Tax=Clostridium felsineum TaxID=36839 RepID=UPI00098C84D3|nr:FeoB-associated Cys-rich membrane protein [Clostridium felsineum]MCR3760076.1 FeoB-associated Cys-rich membrane protein [Clostridium felsineum]